MGPDGYPTGFYKVAWAIIDEKIIQTIVEFFVNGRLLKQINATFLALILKECVTTCSFSMSLNGNIHGFFPGSRGLRKGDPVSPYLFVLIMEEIGLFQLSFADDLLLFSSVDETSVGVFKRGMQLFTSLSGLCANPDKSQLIILKSTLNKRDMLL
ncbi:UNVERIFIED_CONTAM: hypothetical protein Sangu_1444300 [Sesamum angustifolium]|uniref:Reverse transcriptase domain-containing protein n=1 Tax=Sesamum angustifolium TaxID=2727405 RepID=A0AAW2N8K1_9LAMI